MEPDEEYQQQEPPRFVQQDRRPRTVEEEKERYVVFSLIGLKNVGWVVSS